MVGRSSELRRTLPALIASIPITIVFFAVLGIVLTAAGPNGLDLSDEQTSSWIAVLYGFPTLIALVLTVRYRQPLLITGNIFAIIFFVSLGDQVGFPELAGASMLAGAIVLVGGRLRAHRPDRRVDPRSDRERPDRRRGDAVRRERLHVPEHLPGWCRASRTRCR